MNYINKICSFTGYRTAKLQAALKKSGRTESDLRAVISEEINRLIIEGFEVFQCGMALGSDIMFAETVLEYKKQYPTIKLAAFVPCLEQDSGWDAASKEKYRNILQLSDDIKLISNSTYFNGCMQKRNIELVKTCDLLLAVYSGDKGGTMHTVEYAKRNSKNILVIDPENFLKITLNG